MHHFCSLSSQEDLCACRNFTSFLLEVIGYLSLWLGEWVPRWQALQGSVMMDSEKDRVSSPVGKRVVVYARKSECFLETIVPVVSRLPCA